MNYRGAVKIENLGFVMADNVEARFTDWTLNKPVQYSHADIYERAMRVTSLFDGTVGPVAIMTSPGRAWVVTLLALVLAGRTVVAVPDTWTSEQFTKEAKRLSVALVVGDSELSAGCGIPHLSLERVEEAEAGPELSAPQGNAALSVIAFTSGTTSGPSATAFLVEGESTELLAREFAYRFALTSDDTWAVCHSLSHLPHLEYVLASFMLGMHLTLTTPAKLILNMPQIQPAVVVGVPAVYESLVKRIENRAPGRVHRWAIRLPHQFLSAAWVRWCLRRLQPAATQETGARLKVLIIGAAPSSMRVKVQLAAWGVPVFEGYGTSELGMLFCNSPKLNQLGSVGTIWPGVSARLTSSRGIEVVSVHSRMVGYIDTAGTVIKSASEWQATGDTGTISRSGFLRITGREKDVLVTGKGKKLNPVAIEAALIRLAGTTSIWVTLNESDRLCVLTPAGNNLAPEMFERWNKTAAAEEIVYGVYELSETTVAKALTRTGKVIRSQLPDLLSADREVWTANPG